MIKKVFVALLLALPFTAMAQVKMGVVNTQEIFTAMPETAKAQADLEASAKKYQDELTKLEGEIKKTQEEIQALPADTPDAIKERRYQTLQELGQRYQQFQQTAAQDIQRQQEALLAPITASIQNAIKAVGDEGSYTMIFEVTPPVVYTNPTTTEDVTAKVKAKLGIK